MKKLLILILVVAIFASSCGITGQNTSSLSSMLSLIPSEKVTGSILWFYDMEKIKDMAGLGANTGIEGYQTIEQDRRESLFAGLTLSYFSGREAQELWKDIFGFNSFDVTQEVWLQRATSEQPGSSFSVMKGNFDENYIKEKLNGLGYQGKDYESNSYYAINENNKVGDVKNSQAARIAMSFLNRMVVTEHEIIAAPADDILFSVLDVRSAKDKSLADSLAYTRVAETLGDVLGAALIPQSTLLSENTDAGWGSLHPYDLAGIGYQVEGQDRLLTIVLHYPDNSASLDVEELTRRLSEYIVSVGNLEEPRISALFDIGNPEAVSYNPDSILKIELKYKASTRVTLSSIWHVLIDMNDLGFLVVNPSE